MVFTDFQRQYGRLSNEELLRLTSDSSSLVEEARAALDCELRNRGLTYHDVSRHQDQLKHDEQGEKRKKTKRSRRNATSWIDNAVGLFWSALGIGLIWMAYLAVPPRYRFSPDWQEAAGYTMITSVMLVAASFGRWLKKAAFWISLLVSSVSQALLVHWWIARKGSLDGHDRLHRVEWPVLLGMGLFLIVYGSGSSLRRKLQGKQAASGLGLSIPL